MAGRSIAVPPVWTWLNILSLDAPLVALVWQDFVARCYPAMLRPGGRAALGLTVWAIYLADRLLDTRKPPHGRESMRHGFYRRFRLWAVVLLALVLCADLLVVSIWVRPVVLRDGIVLAAGVALYLMTFALRGRGAVFAKKSVAAALFTAGTFLVAWAGTVDAVSQLPWPVTSLFALCLVNLLLTEAWERGISTGHWALFALLPILWLFGRTAPGYSSQWLRATCLSGIGLAFLAFRERWISREARCIAADVVLLSPLLFR